MTSTEWPQVDPMPSMEPSNSGTDLFDGDILGDELIDIYNAAVVGGSDDDAINEIPTLLAPTPEADKKDGAPLNHPGADVDANAAMDDGLGAFRPSTSFNDLATLLPPTSSAGNANGTPNPPTLPPVMSSPTLEQEKSVEAKKRAPTGAPSETPAAKRRVSTVRRNSGGAVNSKASIGSSAAQKGKTGTPNPLTFGDQPTPAPSGVKVQPVKAIAKPALAASPAVVTPRVQTKVPEPVAVVSAPAPPPLAAPPTEADFKSVAQAAVSNLIMNAGSSTKSDSSACSGSIPMKIDTSTEHIKALTGSNWVAVCSGGDAGEAANAAADKMNNRARRQNLTPDERARQNRDRNREHARNTRLRKKAYVEELKRTLTALVSQRDSAEVEKRHSAQRELEQREVRFRVIEEFLKLRGRNEVNFARWAAILEEHFTLALPLTEFREMAPSQRSEYEQVFSGVSEAMTDSNLLASFLQSLGKSEKASVSLSYHCDRKNFFMDNCMAVLDWTVSTSGAVQQGAAAELTSKGSLKAKFSPASNKLISVKMSFDTGMIMSQLNPIFKSNEVTSHDVEAAAQVAASEADAILDSLQMPHIEATSVPSNVTLVPPSGPGSITDAEKEDSSDESNNETDDPTNGVTNRRLRVRHD